MMIRLVTPHQTAPNTESFATHRSEVKAWLNSLHDKAIGQKSKALYRGLKHSNRLENKPSERIEIMELFRPEIRATLTALERHYISLSLPLPAKSQQIFDLVIAFLQEMAFGYKIAILDASENNKPLSARHTALAAQRAIAYLTEVQVRCSQIYYLPPRGLWADMNQLYAYVESCGQHLRHVKNKELITASKESVEDAYKRALLFYLCRPESLRRGESQQVYNALETGINYTSLSKSEVGKEYTTSFAINLASDAPPSNQRFLNPLVGQHIRVLNIEALVQRINEELAKRPRFDPPLLNSDQLTRATLERLAVNWSTGASRSMARSFKNQRIVVEVGLKDIHTRIHYLINKNTKLQQKAGVQPDLKLELQAIPVDPKKYAGYISHPLFSEEADLSADLWRKVEGGYTFTEGSVTAIKEKDDAPSQPPKKVQKQTWKLINASTQGFGLAWEGKDAIAAHVGEVIALQILHKQEIKWSVGTIRWIQFSSKTAFTAGVELLSPAVLPITTRRMNASGNLVEGTAQESLLLPEIRTQGQNTSIILPSFMFDIGQKVSVEINGNYFQVILQELVEQTGSFSLFRVKFMASEKHEQLRSADQTVDKDWDDFAIDWEKLP